MKKIYSFCIGILSFTTVFSQVPVTVGTTTEDLQTYFASTNHIINSGGGKVSVSWKYSDNLGGTTDVGTGYNFFNGATWGALPTNRLEGQHTYGSELLKVIDHELVVADDVSHVRLYKNSAIGATDWSLVLPGDADLSTWYPMAYCEPGTQTVYVVGQKPSAGEDLNLSRSDDGGATWAIADAILPYATEAVGCPYSAAGAYQVVAKGDSVWVLNGSLGQDLILMRSGDKGATWNYKVLQNFPVDNYTAGPGQTTDWDGDGDYDHLDTNDGRHEMIITPGGTVHVFASRMQIWDGAGTGFYDDYTKGGIFHWKTGDAAATLHTEFMIDWDGDGDPMSGISDDENAYDWESFTCMPTASYDNSLDRIYLSYMMPVEGEYGADGQNYFDLFGSYSDDGGNTWSPPINLTNSACSGKENAFPSANPTTVASKFNVMWMQDDKPGTSVDLYSPDARDTNYIKYVAWDSTRFSPYDPTVDFSFTLTPAPGFFATFTNLSVDACDYLWDFGDGANSTAVNPTHTYTEGTYTVCLTAYNHYGEATTCHDLVAITPPIALFGYSVTDATATFTNLTSGTPPITYLWDFGDGATSTATNPTHTYAVNGDYYVCLTATNAAGSDSYCATVHIEFVVATAPNASFTYSAGATCGEINFFDTSTQSPTSWLWDFGDGGTSTEQNPVHTFTYNNDTPGFTVCLIATNDIGSDEGCLVVSITCHTVPTALFSYTGDPTVTFTDESTEYPTSWAWTFGDGGVSSLQNPVHTYASNGTYSVCLIATNPQGPSIANCQTLIIGGYAAPVALFTHVDTGDPTIVFTEEATNDDSWFWEFGDGTFSTAENPTHTYAANGTYSVCLTATGPGGNDMYCEDVVIDGLVAPEAFFTYTFPGGLLVDFTDESTNTPTMWSWNFGDGGTSTLQNPTHYYPVSGTYYVCLTDSNAYGDDTYCEFIDVLSAIETNDAGVLNIYPNPADEFVIIQLANNSVGAIITIQNVLGENVNVKNIVRDGNLITLDVSNIAAGTYIINISNDKGKTSRQLIVSSEW